MDNRFSKRWSNSTVSLPETLNTTTPTSTASSASRKSSHLSPSQKYHVFPPSYPKPSTSHPGSNPRWSSHLSFVETIDYDDQPEVDSRSPTLVKMKSSPDLARSRLRRSKSHLVGIMRQMFSKKETNMSSEAASLPKPTATKNSRFSRKDPVVLKELPQEEGGQLWNRLSIIIRPSRAHESDKLPKRVDSAVDVRNYSLPMSRSTPNLKARPTKQSQPPPTRLSVFSSISTTSLPSISLTRPQKPGAHTRTSSLPPPLPLPSKTLILSPAQIAYLLTEISNAQTIIQNVFAETEAFSKNLAGLLWSKERLIVANKRLDEATRTQMTGQMSKIRDETARCFCKKGLFFERSLGVLAKLRAELLQTEDVGSEITTPMESPSSSVGSGNDASSSSRRSLSPDSTTSSSPTLFDSDFPSLSPSSSQTTAHTTSTSTTAATKPPSAISLVTLHSALSILKADLTAQSHLDPKLRNTVVLPTQETRFPSTDSERVAMRRFVRFVDGRIKRLQVGYWELGRWVRGLESWVDDVFEEV